MTFFFNEMKSQDTRLGIMIIPPSLHWYFVVKDSTRKSGKGALKELLRWVMKTTTWHKNFKL